MRLCELDLMQFLPAWTRDDRTAAALAYAVQQQLERVIASTGDVLTYPAVDRLPGAILDELAWQFNIPEYDAAMTEPVKRRLVKSALLTHRQRGTVAAVERVVTDIFGSGWVEEWPDYDGTPYHFKVHTSNISAGDTQAAGFTAAVKATQNLRSVLDAIIVEAVVEQQLEFSGYLHLAEKIYI